MKFTVSILAFNRLDLTRKCIASVLAHSGKDFEIILSDNASSDGTWPYFQELVASYPNVIRAARNEKNLGFITPNRRAIEQANGDFFVTLNNDATVPLGWLDRMQAEFTKHPKAALVGARGSCQQIDHRGNGRPGPVLEYIEGSCMMGRTTFLRRLGLFAAELEFAYWEDVWLSLRVREMGYSIHLADFAIEHVRGATSSTVPGILDYQRKNGAFVIQQFGHYMHVRRFDYPTVVRRMAAWGDTLLTTPIIRELRRRRPLSPIYVETKCPDVFRGNPHVRAVNVARPPDAQVFDLDMAYENRPGLNIIDAYAEVSGLTTGLSRITEFHVTPEEMAWADEQLPGEAWIGVHVGPTSWPGKNWPSDRWRALIVQLVGKVVLLGGDASVPYRAHADLRGRTTVGELAAALRQCRLLISVDSFPLHLAQAVGTPVLGLFGVTLPEIILTDGSISRAVTADVSHPATGARHRVAGQTMVNVDSNPMETITVDAVLAAAREMLR